MQLKCMTKHKKRPSTERTAKVFLPFKVRNRPFPPLDIDECKSDPCKNGGMGINKQGSYTRICNAHGLMVSALDSGSSGPGSCPGRGHCAVFFGKTLYSHGDSLHPGV